MSPLGPQLPTQLDSKRKRKASESFEETLESQPLHARDDPRIRSSSSSDTSKRPKVLGPLAPPAPLDQQPPSTAHQSLIDDDSDDDDDFGPALPPPTGASEYADQRAREATASASQMEKDVTVKPQRQAWMLVPPSSDDWSSRVDPTKLRNRKFNSGKGAKGPAVKDGDNTTWLETPEEKRKRLDDEVMGRKKPANAEQAKGHEMKNAKGDADSRKTDQRIREYNVGVVPVHRLLTDSIQESHRNASLYDEHKTSTTKEKEDDPSARAFDREKDIGGGMKIGHAKRKELLAKAADFGSRFAKGSYL